MTVAPFTVQVIRRLHTRGHSSSKREWWDCLGWVSGQKKKKKKKPCFDFFKGKCKRGDNCIFQHTLPGAPTPVPMSKGMGALGPMPMPCRCDACS